MNEKLESEIRRIISDVFELPEEAIQEDVNFYTTYNIDSLRLIEIVVELEKRLSLHIPPPELDLEGIQTFGDLLNLIRNYFPKEQLAAA